MLLLCIPTSLQAQFDNASVYGAVLQKLVGERHLRDEILVRETSSAPEFTRPLDDLDRGRELIERLLSAAAEQVPATALGLPPNVRYVSDAEAQGLIQGSTERVDVFSVSPIVYSEDGSQAAVYAEVSCGFLCASGGGFLLTRQNGHWKVWRRFWRWVS